MDYQKIASLQDNFAHFAGLNIDEAVAPSALGTFHFGQARSSLLRVVNFAKIMLNGQIDVLPEDNIDNMNRHFGEIRKRLEHIAKFSIEASSNPSQDRENIVSSILAESNALLSENHPYWILSVLAIDQTSKLQAELRNATDQARAILSTTRDHADKAAAELDKAVLAAKEAAGKTGVQTHATDFGTQAKSHGNIAIVWLVVTILLASLTLGATVLAFFYHPVLITTADTLNWITTKLLVLTVLGTATLWCGRLYKSEKHQQAVNRHRQHALETFETFIAASLDDATKDAVLLATTQSIFALASPGYLAGDDGNAGADGGLKIIELIKSISSVPK